MKSLKAIKNIKIKSSTVKKGSKIAIAIGTILKASCDIAESVSKQKK